MTSVLCVVASATALLPTDRNTLRSSPSSAATLFAQQENARAQIRIPLAQLVAAFQIFLRDDVRLEQHIPLKIRQRLEEDSGSEDDLQSRGDSVPLQCVQGVGNAVAMGSLIRSDRRVVCYEPHRHRDLPRRSVRVRTDQEEAAVC